WRRAASARLSLRDCIDVTVAVIKESRSPACRVQLQTKHLRPVVGPGPPGSDGRIEQLRRAGMDLHDEMAEVLRRHGIATIVGEPQFDLTSLEAGHDDACIF